MYLSQEELKTHLYSENVDAITRGDNTIIAAAIDTAIQEAKGYLGTYDRDTIFASIDDARNALLLTFVKDMASWHLINLCNAGSDFKLRQDRYDRAVEWLKAVQKGNVSPDLPLLTSEDGTTTVAGISFGSNLKRGQHF